MGVSDDFSVYKNAFTHHQLCRAHPIRKLRDLTQSRKLSKEKLAICEVAYKGLRALHADLLEALEKGTAYARGYLQQLHDRFDELCVPVQGEPQKLTTLRTSLAKNKAKYFTCVHHAGVPTTNNTAERMLRPLVIKRKLCFGSKTANGASIMEVLYSVVYSLIAYSRTHFFYNYQLLKA